VRFLIRDRVYHKAWARWFYRFMGGIPVSPGGREAAMALREALRRLQAGELVGIFPEGGLRPEGMTEIVFPGAALLAVRGNAPVIPVSIRGSAAAWPPGCKLPRPWRVEVEIGRPIDPPQGRSRNVVDEMVRRIESALRDMGPAVTDGSHGTEPPEESAWTRR
jgi:1-acyl-sn-glycerol-3-phosphate acyltransferase